ncbi:MAG: TauD/TfdA family dioxygenase [Novosphingobium sp.]
MGLAGDIAIERVTRNIGAVINGIDLRQPQAAQTVDSVRQALINHGVVFFRRQDISLEQFWAFLENFGHPQKEEIKGTDHDRPSDVHTADMSSSRYSTATWHADTTSLPRPPIATALRAAAPPEFGGDTCWSSMYAAWDALSDRMQRMLDGMTAVHSIKPTADAMQAYGQIFLADYEARHGGDSVHPVVLTHPESGRKALYVSECFTTRIVELSPTESAAVLPMLFHHIQRPDFMMRWKWSTGDIAFWDNRSVQHYAVPDYDEARVMQRIVLGGAKPGEPSALVPARRA